MWSRLAIISLALVSACTATDLDSPTPIIREAPQNAIELLDCDGRPSEMGGLASEFGPDAGGDTPDEAFAAFIASAPFTIPRTGYGELIELDQGAIYTYAAQGRVSVVVVISTRFADMVGSRFAIDEMRTCDPVEYGPAVELGEGRTVWAHPSGRIITDIVGPTHCDWETIRILHLTYDEVLVAQYIRDPTGVIPQEALLETYAEGVGVPHDASPSGYRHGDLELWFSESDTALYVVDATGKSERWPKTARTIGCA